LDAILRSSRPNAYFFNLLNAAFDDVIIKRLDSQGPPISHLINGKYLIGDGEACTWFIANSDNELLGFWCLSVDEIAELQTKIGDEAALREALAMELLSPWTEEGRLRRKVSNYIEAWLHTQYEVFIGGTHIRWLLQGELRVIVSITLRNDQNVSGTLSIPPELESELKQRPPVDCSLKIASTIDNLMSNFVDLNQTHRGDRPNVSALIRRLTT
jgi:hypothetical protein